MGSPPKCVFTWLYLSFALGPNLTLCLLISYAIWAIRIIKHYAIPHVIIARVTCSGHPTLRAKIVRISSIHLPKKSKFQRPILESIVTNEKTQTFFGSRHACIFIKASMSTFTSLYRRMSDYQHMKSSASFRPIFCSQHFTTTY